MNVPEYAPAVIWGLILGLLLLPAYVVPYHLVLLFRRPWWPVISTIAYMFAANLVGILGAGGLFVVILKLSGINSVHPHISYFGWSFLAGMLLCRAAIEIRKKSRRNAA